VNEARLRAIDLNLLLVLNALLQRGSVKGAAERLAVTPSAVSHSLAKLRELFDDPILVRTSNGYRPTPRAADLVAPLERVIDGVRHILGESPDFDPASARRTYRLKATDLAEIVLLPALMRHLRNTAPGVDIKASPHVEDIFVALESGHLDLVTGRFDDAPAGFYRQKLFEERFVCLFRRGHPALREALTLERYAALDHLLVSPRGRDRGTVDDALAPHGLERRIALTVPHFLVAPAIVAETDLVLTAPVRIAERHAHLPIELVTPPLELGSFSVSQLWHERVHKSPAHAWLRAAIAGLDLEPAPTE
jgi:DNA-binding transcriptional LysR family regulator